MPINLKPENAGDRVELMRKKKHEPGSVKFTRLPNGQLRVSGDAAPQDIAAAITRSKKRHAEARAPIGAERAARLKARLRRKLDEIE